ncbi:hypothetical protein XM38_001670 [Halomicronema hongdechloris C2206]|uniref:Phage holin family protein n=1 Tax=Halomicronema hongdechloris C2206 TaxID=1641165 RepID=A0A1Z3HG23_9CYAN|nr:phage holin family protein [Halomicronema hongdechloris]ASC69240.1 hypothetical protein XM38_001670 [Halomicronema hongdechloris C2206]
MDFLISFLLSAIITAIALLIIARIPFLGVEVDTFGKALMAGIVFGVLNGLLSILGFLNNPLLALFTLGLSWLLYLILNVIVFGLSALLVEGFRLRKGIWSAVMGAIALSIVNSILSWILGAFGLSAG